MLAGFAAFLDLYSTQPLLPMLARTFRASHFAVSLTVTALDGARGGFGLQSIRTRFKATSVLVLSRRLVEQTLVCVYEPA